MREIVAWFTAHLPADLYADTPEITVDREEISIIGAIPAGEGAEDTEAFRERTRRERMTVAAAAEDLFGRKVAWGVRAGEQRVVFTHLAVPVMTRLRQRERQVLDTLVSAGVARSRADALAWCVRLVAEHEGDWIGRMQDAVTAVHEARDSGPRDSRPAASA